MGVRVIWMIWGTVPYYFHFILRVAYIQTNPCGSKTVRESSKVQWFRKTTTSHKSIN